MAPSETAPTFYTIHQGESPLVATAIHSGHQVRDNISGLFALPEIERLREEDPFTDHWTTITDNRIIGHHSRFELDLNRSRDKAIYRIPEDAWGLTVWENGLPENLAKESFARYDSFYEAVRLYLEKLLETHSCLVVYDLHTYNHKRGGADGPEADPGENPEANIGTGNMNRQLWAPVVDTFMSSLQQYNYKGRQLDVRENVKFKGGHFMRWLHDSFPDRICVLSIEFKKFFMNEWTGKADPEQLEEIKRALQHTTEPVLRAREQVCLKL